MRRKKRETEVSAKGETPTLDQIRATADQYADSPLECDGLTNVLHFHLARAQIGHCVKEGHVENIQGHDAITWHRWIEIQAQEGLAIVDYRARMWLENREGVPHGVFLTSSYPHMHYQGQEIELLPLSETIIGFMVERPDIPPEWKEAYHL